jgi:hypothetical protein
MVSGSLWARGTQSKAKPFNLNRNRTLTPIFTFCEQKSHTDPDFHFLKAGDERCFAEFLILYRRADVTGRRYPAARRDKQMPTIHVNGSSALGVA